MFTFFYFGNYLQISGIIVNRKDVSCRWNVE